MAWPINATIQTCTGTTTNPKIPVNQSMPLPACQKGESAPIDHCICSTASGHCDGFTGVYVATAERWEQETWEVSPVKIMGEGWTPFNASVATLGESNPSWIGLRHGGGLLAFRSHLKGGYWPHVEGEHIGFALSTSGPEETGYNISANLSWQGQVAGGMPGGNDEDPFVWQQPDGTLHCLYHNGRGRDTNLGLHAFSRDGLLWHKPADSNSLECISKRHCSAMYGNEIELDNGTTFTLLGRERPTLIFDPVTHRPTHLYNGAIPPGGKSRAGGAPWYAMAQAIRG